MDITSLTGTDAVLVAHARPGERPDADRVAERGTAATPQRPTA